VSFGDVDGKVFDEYTFLGALFELELVFDVLC
jgi:hypothetical protein